MRYLFSEIVSIISPLLVKGESVEEIHSVDIDSRTIKAPETTIFLALSTESGNGHNYIQEAYDKGVRHFIVEDIAALEELEGVSYLQVYSSLKALQKFAKYHRSLFKIPVIAITGSNGKTIVKEWLSQLLMTTFIVVKSPKSYNSQIGVPLSILRMEKTHEVAIFEAGISEPGEMDALYDMIRPTHGVFTNLGAAHDAYFSSRKQKAVEKNKLFKNVVKLVFSSTWSEFISNPNSKTWGTEGDVEVNINVNNKEAQISLVFKDSDEYFTIPFSDKASIENAINAYLMAKEIGVPSEVLENAIQKITPVAMRLELREAINDCYLISDYYNADISGISIALDFMRQQKGEYPKTVILSDIFESKESTEQLITSLDQLFVSNGVNRLIVIGEQFAKNLDLFQVPVFGYASTEAFLKQFINLNFNKESILLKGQRSFHFEKIAEKLQRKLHSTYLEIDLNAVRNNLNYFKQQLFSSTKIMVMVKALAYGSGNIEMAQFLNYVNVDYLGVAFVDEGIELRKSGIDLPIMVLNPSPESYELMLDYNLEPEVYNWKSLDEVISVAEKRSEQTPIHIKIDTGMHRLGFVSEDIQELIGIIKNNNKINIKSVFSHLATSDEPGLKEHTLRQLNSFNEVLLAFEESLDYTIDAHILNSAGILAFPEGQHSMVRLGLGLYGITPFEQHRGALQPVSQLKTIVSQIKYLKKGDAVGYGRREIAQQDLATATVPIGYADGLPRLVGNRKGYMLVNGQKAPIIGNVCMDMTMLDVSAIEVKEGDEVEVFGKNIHPDKLANWAQTISYEILTNISSRVKRIYVQD